MPKLNRVLRAIITFLLFITSFGFSVFSGGKTIKVLPVLKISVADNSNQTIIKIIANSNLNYSLKKNENTLVVSFPGLNTLKLEKKNFTSQLIKSIDLAKGPEAYLLTFKLISADFSYNHSVSKNPFTITINLKAEKNKEAAEKINVASEGKSGLVQGKVITAAAQNQVAPPANEVSGPNNPAQKQVKTIVIDPGHGGMETGAKGNFGTLEKDVTLAISKKLKDEIERGLKYRVVMTREDDVLVPLDKRAAIANNNKADLFISIHANGSRRSKASGSETFFLSLNATDEEARRLAYFENNSGELKNEVTTHDFDDLKLILWDMAQAAYIKQSSQLAELVQNELNELLNTKNRGIKQAPFKVLTGVACPAILVEVAFITNPEEEKLLQSEEFQSKVAEAIYLGLNKFLQLYGKQ